MSNIPVPPSPHDDRFGVWVRAVALTAAATAMSENSGVTDHHRPTVSTVTTNTLSVAKQFARYIETGA